MSGFLAHSSRFPTNTLSFCRKSPDGGDEGGGEGGGSSIVSNVGGGGGSLLVGHRLEASGFPWGGGKGVDGRQRGWRAYEEARHV
jgi:hypothetical protein